MPSRRRRLGDRAVLAGALEMFVGVVRYRSFLYGLLEAEVPVRPFHERSLDVY